MTQIIDGKKISQEIKDELREQVAEQKKLGKEAALAVIQVGTDPASSVYVNNKKKACTYIGIGSLSYELPEETTEEELLALVEKLNGDASVNGILVQLPLPAQIDADKVIRAIAPEKDVDGFHPENVGKLVIGEPGFVSCTPAGIIQLLKRSGIKMEGKYRGEADGTFNAARECHGHHCTFQDTESAGNLQNGGYPDRCNRKAAVYHGRLHQRRGGCHRCGNSPR